MKLNDRSYWRTMPTAALLDAAKYSDNELAIVLGRTAGRRPSRHSQALAAV
jgi:hypothetical protein